jgi:hypothetical protein
MKKLFALVLALCLTLSATAAFAADDPFLPGINYNMKYSDNGCVPSMLNFGYASLAPGESLYDVNTTTVTQSSAKNIEKSLERLTYYIYAKWQCARGFDYNFIDAMLVMTDPTGNYYATYGEWEQFDMKAKTVYSWFFEVNDLLQRCIEDHGSLPRGQYTFSMFFNDQAFRVNKVHFQ